MRALSTEDRLWKAAVGSCIATFGFCLLFLEGIPVIFLKDEPDRWFITFVLFIVLGIHQIYRAFHPKYSFRFFFRDWNRYMWIGSTLAVATGILLVRWFDGGSHVFLLWGLAAWAPAYYFSLRAERTFKKKWDESRTQAPTASTPTASS